MTKIVQVLGPSRGGSTMMHLMLGHSDNAFACGELYALFRPWRDNQLKPQCTCTTTNSQCIWHDVPTQNERDAYRHIADATGADWLIDESKVLSWVLDSHDWAELHKMEIYNILMVKDPLALMYSKWRRNNQLNGFIQDWRSYHKRFINLNIPFVSVNLEQLCANPAEKLQGLCDIIGMEYFPGKESFWKKKHCHLFGSNDVRQQMMAGESKIRKPKPFPDAFIKDAEPLIKAFKADQEISSILEKLNSCEVSQKPDLQSLAQTSSSRAGRPLWWWVDKGRTAYRIRFPHKARFSE